MTLALVPRPDERLTPMERLEVLCDPGSLDLLRTEVLSRRMGEKARPGDGVLGASGRVDGRVVAVFAQDASFAGGSLGEAHAETVVAVLELAERSRVPVIGFVESAGARMQEGLAALSGYAKIFRKHVALSGHVPQISVICGPSAGGGSYAPALTDFVIMTETREHVPHRPRRGRQGHRRGRRHRGAGRPSRARAQRRLPARRADRRRCGAARARPARLPAAELRRASIALADRRAARLPSRQRRAAEDRKVYDVREVARALLDGGRMLEISPRWARNVVCAFGRLDGRSIGLVANQPRYLGGVLDVDASQKAARFVRTCNLFGIPLLVLVDTPGFLPGTKQEKLGVIRQGAKLVYAFSECTVPRVTVILRKAFGGAFIAMNSKDLGADFVFAWPSAQLGVMGAPQAVEIINRREIEAADDPVGARDALASSYAAEHLHPGAATADGYVDEVIAPSETRARVAAALAALDSAALRRWPAGNIPL